MGILTALRSELHTACWISELRTQAETIRGSIVVDHIDNTVGECSCVGVVAVIIQLGKLHYALYW